ncbi:MAG: hypothetical protein WA364_12990 [Candidatus Nitrosopolaris sp.]
MKKPSREWVKKLIKKACDDLHVTRESLNIFAGARAVMYFQGNWSSVKFDDVKSLARNGTDILFIEKMGIVEIFTEHADKYGIAIVNTQGLLTEYGKDLMKEAQRQGGHVAILSDYDDHGLLMASKVPDIPRIGIDESTFHYFGLSRQVLSIEGQQRLVNYKFLDIFDDKTIDKEFVKKRRVEIDAILEQVGDERLWGYTMEKLIELFPTRDYNRVISMPAVETLYPMMVKRFLGYINFVTNKITNDEEIKIKNNLNEVKGMLVVGKIDKEIGNHLKNLVLKDNGMKIIESKITELLNSDTLPDSEQFLNLTNEES